MEYRVIKRKVKVTLTGLYLRALDQLVEKGIYMTPQSAIREALRRLFKFHGIEPFYKELVEEEVDSSG